MGPKFIIDHSLDKDLKVEVGKFIRIIGVRGKFPTKVNRIDLALDLFGVEIWNQNIEEWRKNWIGRSGVSSIFFNSRSRELKTINIGSRSSAVYLRIYDKIAESLKNGDINYWFDVWAEYVGPVTRVEWEIKPKDSFDKLMDFWKLRSKKIAELLNYLVAWGRLCVLNPNDSNKRRWELAEFWEIVTSAADVWDDGIYWPTSRRSKEFKGVSEEYIRGVAGTVSGAMARLNPEKPTLFSMLDEMDEYGSGLEEIQKDAEKKADVFSRT